MVRIYAAALVMLGGLLGASIASFAQLVCDRLPRRESIVVPASHCTACQHRLWPHDLIPVISWLLLGGKCRYCKAAIPPSSLYVELAGAVLGIVLSMPLLLGV